jgi:glyoxylase-like metal-dependent hydrolase (beta-lactamase superfamily II)
MNNATRGVLLILALLAVPLAALHAQEELTIQRVKDGLWMIVGSGGNVGVRVTSEGVILVDDKFPQNFADIQRLVRTVSDLPVRYVLNTHHHGDHSGGNAQYVPLAEVIAHQNARDNMVRANQEGQPRVVFTDQTAVFLGGVEVRAYHMGTGHTNGDAVIYFPDLQTVHGGDLLHGVAPFIDYGNGGSSKGWVATVNNILALPFDTAIPGHGAIMNRGDVTAFRNQMEAVRAQMATLIRGGGLRRDVATRFVSPELPWTTIPTGLFMQRSVAGLYDEIAEEVRP